MTNAMSSDTTSAFSNLLIGSVWSADTDAIPIDHIEDLSNIPNLIKLYRDPQKSEHDERSVLMLLLTIARHSKTAARKEEARAALLELGIVSENNLTYVQHGYGLCECKGRSQCMCMAYLLKLQQLYDELNPCINEHQSYWVYRVTTWLVYLVQNYEKGSYYCSEAMTEAMEMVQRTFFMMTFVDLFDGCHSVQCLNGLLTRFVHISSDTYNQMNPQYALLQLGEEEEEEEEEEEQEKYIDPLFLQEHDVSHTHILQVLRHKLAESTSGEEKKMIGEMLKRLADLNALLY
jgi:hypothetical protein